MERKISDSKKLCGIKTLSLKRCIIDTVSIQSRQFPTALFVIYYKWISFGASDILACSSRHSFYLHSHCNVHSHCVSHTIVHLPFYAINPNRIAFFYVFPTINLCFLFSEDLNQCS